VGDIDR